MDERIAAAVKRGHPCPVCGAIQWLDPHAELEDFRNFLAETIEACIQNASTRHDGVFKSDDLANAIIDNLPWRKVEHGD